MFRRPKGQAFAQCHKILHGPQNIPSRWVGHPCHVRCVLSRFCCNGHSLLLSSYLFRIGIENPSCSACGHPSQDTSHLILHCPATDSLRRSLFGDFLSLCNLWTRPWGVSRLLGLHDLPPYFHRSEGVG